MLKLKIESRNVLFQNYQVKERTGGSVWEYELAWGHTEAPEDQVVFPPIVFSSSFLDALASLDFKLSVSE